LGLFLLQFQRMLGLVVFLWRMASSRLLLRLGLELLEFVQLQRRILLRLFFEQLV
jgi:hypothetical protein